MSNIGTERFFVLKKYIPFIIFCLLTLLCVAFIFSNSAKTGEESGNASSSVLEFIKKAFASLGIDADISERFVRKFAHFCEYMLLSLLVCADVLSFIKGFMSSERVYPYFVLAPIFAFCVACVDEFCVQASTLGRGPSFTDVCIDTSGAVVGAVLFGIALFAVSFLKKRKTDL